MLERLKFEQKIWDSGLSYIAGVDEAGRGPLAGPLVVAAVILNKEHLHELKNAATEVPTSNHRNNDVPYPEYLQINDSKKIAEKKREMLFEFVVKNAIAYSVEEIPAAKIDEWGIARANQIGFYNIVRKLAVAPEHIFTDHFGINAIPVEKQTNLTKGDSLSLSIGAASIVAKVTRDRLMLDYHKKFPEYGFDAHKGYGTQKHRAMLEKHGPCEIHRKSFRLG